MDPNISLSITIKYDSINEAKLVHDSLIPEIMDHDFDRSKVSIELKELLLMVNIESQDISAAKANINSILRWISLISESTQLLSKRSVIRYS